MALYGSANRYDYIAHALRTHKGRKFYRFFTDVKLGGTTKSKNLHRITEIEDEIKMIIAEEYEKKGKLTISYPKKALDLLKEENKLMHEMIKENMKEARAKKGKYELDTHPGEFWKPKVV